MQIKYYNPGEIYSKIIEGVEIIDAWRVGCICFLRIRVTGNIFDPDTDYLTSQLNALKPKFASYFALAGAGNVFSGNVSILTDGTIKIRISDKRGYYDTTISYPTNGL